MKKKLNRTQRNLIAVAGIIAIVPGIPTLILSLLNKQIMPGIGAVILVSGGIVLLAIAFGVIMGNTSEDGTTFY